MFCSQCGAQIAPGAKFCPQCGTPMVAQQQVTYTPPVNYMPKKSGKKMIIAIISVFVVLTILLFGLDMFVINSAASLEDKLVGQVWYSEVTTGVSVETGESCIIAYSLEFHADGTATRKGYAYKAYDADEGDADKMEVISEEEIDWEIDWRRRLTIDGETYSYKGEDGWKIDGDELSCGRFYSNDKW